MTQGSQCIYSFSKKQIEMEMVYNIKNVQQLWLIWFVNIQTQISWYSNYSSVLINKLFEKINNVLFIYGLSTFLHLRNTTLEWLSKCVLALLYPSPTFFPCPPHNTLYWKKKQSQIVLWKYCETHLGLGFTLGSETLFTEAAYHPDRNVKSLSMHQSFLEYFATFW